MQLVPFPIQNSVLSAVPIFENRKGGRNWLAVVAQVAGGKMDRTFLPWAPSTKEGARYQIQTLTPGDVIEFGADHKEGKHPSTQRWYGVVTEHSPTKLVVMQCNTLASAFSYKAQVFPTAPAAAAPAPTPAPSAPQSQPVAAPAPEAGNGKKEALLDEKKKLLFRLGEIEFQLSKLQ